MNELQTAFYAMQRTRHQNKSEVNASAGKHVVGIFLSDTNEMFNPKFTVQKKW